MKRKLLSLLLATALVFSTTACSIGEGSDKKSDKKLSKNDIEDALEEAEELMDDEEWKDAVEIYKEILESDDECVEAYLNLAECYIKLDKMEKAEKILSKGLKKTDNDKKIKKMYKEYFEDSVATTTDVTEATEAATTEAAATEATEATTADMPADTAFSQDLYDASYDIPHTATNDGDVLNIYVWNEEFKSRVAGDGYRVDPIYPGYEYIDSNTGKIGDVTVNWIIQPSEGNSYQYQLDQMLSLQTEGSLSSDDKIDIFLVEADYALKYTGSDCTLTMSEIGLDDYVFNDQYNYTKQIGTYNGDLKAVSWQICPGGLIYNRKIAKEVLGSDDPATVQDAVNDWDSYVDTAKKLNKKGYMMSGSYADSFRAYSNNKSTPWVVNDTIYIDDNLIKWVEDSKAISCDATAMWGDDWARGFFSGKVFCYFGPAWFSNYCMKYDDSKSIAANGGWGIVEGPAPFYWGGTWICAANGTDNKDLVADLIKTMTTDESVLYDIATNYDEIVNNKSINTSSYYDNYSSEVLGGQNPMPVYHNNAISIDISSMSPYDGDFDYSFTSAFENYFRGNQKFDDAFDYFIDGALSKYPYLNY